MGRRGDRAKEYEAVQPTVAREQLEMRWRERLEDEPRLATMVTAAGAGREPLHRWIPYAQGFSPGLVRLYLAETRAIRDPRGVILDPFSGTGTTALECAKCGVPAMGVEALASLTFLSSSRWWGRMSPFPQAAVTDDWHAAAEVLTDPLHRAALMLAIGRQHTTGGQPNRGAKSLSQILPGVIEMMNEDLAAPMTVEATIMQGDARDLQSGLRHPSPKLSPPGERGLDAEPCLIDDESIDGIVTSPPYLSRHDYREVASPYEAVYRHWFPSEADANGQLQASPTTTSTREMESSFRSSALNEAADCLAADGGRRAATMTRNYFADMERVLRECHRVLSPEGVFWLVVGGARIKDVYVPSDLILAELAQFVGFSVENLRVARDLVRPRRKFGRIGHLAPRETVLVMVKR